MDIAAGVRFLATTPNALLSSVFQDKALSASSGAPRSSR